MNSTAQSFNDLTYRRERPAETSLFPENVEFLITVRKNISSRVLRASSNIEYEYIFTPTYFPPKEFPKNFQIINYIFWATLPSQWFPSTISISFASSNKKWSGILSYTSSLDNLDQVNSFRNENICLYDLVFVNE